MRIRRQSAARFALLGLLCAAPLPAQQLADNYIVNGTFDTGLEGWVHTNSVVWIPLGGSPDPGAMRQYYNFGPTTMFAYQCIELPLPERGPYRLSARAEFYLDEYREVSAIPYPQPGCTGTPLESFDARIITSLTSFWSVVSTETFQFTGDPASVRIMVRIGPRFSGPINPYLEVDTIEFGPWRDYQTVSGGAGNDYQASVAVPWGEPDARVMVFERLDTSGSGDLHQTRSDDGGTTWSAPIPVVATAGNERHAALVQTGAEAWSLFHLSNASGSFRIHRATSTDGATFSASVPVDLGWPAGTSQINPHVIREPDGTLTMTYHLLGGASFIARSSDAGATWDTLQTQVSPGNAALPRIAYRASDDTWLLVYQTGSNPVTVWVKTSADPYDWSAPARQLTPDGNNHDAFPVVLADDRLLITWARVANGSFQIFSTRSQGGVDWETPMQHTDRAGLANVQPHALAGSNPYAIELYWGAAQTPDNDNHDIARLIVASGIEVLFANGFETP